jgi:hypothetical protein
MRFTIHFEKYVASPIMPMKRDIVCLENIYIYIYIYSVTLVTTIFNIWEHKTWWCINKIYNILLVHSFPLYGLLGPLTFSRSSLFILERTSRTTPVPQCAQLAFIIKQPDRIQPQVAHAANNVVRSWPSCVHGYTGHFVGLFESNGNSYIIWTIWSSPYNSNPRTLVMSCDASIVHLI